MNGNTVSRFLLLCHYDFAKFNFPLCKLGLTGSVVLRSGRLSDLLLQLQELLKGVKEAEISPSKYDTALIAAQVLETPECNCIFTFNKTDLKILAFKDRIKI